ncbi:RRP15-like protein isoform X2 [Narcine bancroftii]|uniref:RRP15-like protein isoform X2 n=1 Tax=Narcine bancroftii TaxID=1343680 RepID=UPI003831CE61
MAAQVVEASCGANGRVEEEFSGQWTRVTRTHDNREEGDSSDGGLASDEFASGEDDKNNDPEVEFGGECSTPNPNAGWADAMNRILKKNVPGDKPIILAKKKEKQKEKHKQEMLEKIKKLDEKRKREQMCRVKPDIVQDRETERNLQRIATKGVVQLFNAVRKHQTAVDEKVKDVGMSERKRAKLLSSVSKRDFINMLRGSSQSVQQDSAEKTPNSTKQTLHRYEMMILQGL